MSSCSRCCWPSSLYTKSSICPAGPCCCFFALSTFAVSLKRWLLRRLLRAFREKGYNIKHVLLVGCGEQARAYCKAVAQDRSLGFSIDHYLAPHDCLPGLSYLGTYQAISKVLSRINPDEVVIALEAEETIVSERYHREQREKRRPRSRLSRFTTKYMPSHPVIDEIGGVSLVNIRHIPLDNIGNAFLKRTMDIIGSLLLIVVTSPLMLFAAIGVKLSSPGPILFKQERVGLNKKPFYMYKFRSMRVNDKQTTGWSTNSDPRKTRLVPSSASFQLMSCRSFSTSSRGDMSLVGPRPELPFFVNQFKESVPLYMVKHQVRPGITGWAQVNGFRGDTSIQGRIEHDIYYIENWTFLFDIKILFHDHFPVFQQRKAAINTARRAVICPRAAVYFAKPYGWVRCHCHALVIIYSRSLHCGFHPSMEAAFSMPATNTAGSPARRGCSTAGIACPVMRRAAWMISRTEKPLPLPKLIRWLSPPCSRYSSASRCACARSSTWT